MKILITGSHGLVGSALIPFLTTKGHEVIRLIRSLPLDKNVAIYWDPETGRIDKQELEGFDTVIHLAGDNISTARWTPEKKKKILASRVVGTGLLSETLAGMKQPPKTFISASAVGYYGDTKGDLVTEDAKSGTDFLSDVCRQWEDAAKAAMHNGIRVVFARFGVILSASGGALSKMLPPFKWGVGGRLGNGRQYMSWITIDDVILGIDHILNNEKISGPVNFVSPVPVTNREFTSILGSVIKRPTILPLPAVAIRLIFGEMGETILLSGAKACPKKLVDSGYQFLFPELKEALRKILLTSKSLAANHLF